jgi:hypothetical protein
LADGSSSSRSKKKRSQEDSFIPNYAYGCKGPSEWLQ